MHMAESLENPTPGAKAADTNTCLSGAPRMPRLLTGKGSPSPAYNSRSAWNLTIPYTSPAPAPESRLSTQVISYANHWIKTTHVQPRQYDLNLVHVHYAFGLP